MARSLPALRLRDSSHGWHQRNELLEERIEVKLSDIDDVRDSIRIGIRPTSQLHHVTAFLKRRYSSDQVPSSAEDEEIHDDSRIAFYWKGKCLQGNEIPRGASELQYQVYLNVGVRITCSDRLHLRQEDIKQLERQIEEGMTLGMLRSSVSSMMHGVNPFRVVIQAHGGRRSGCLQGNSWEVRKIKAWLCHIIYMDLAPRDKFIVVRGVNEEYVYHPPHHTTHYSFDYRGLQDWLKNRILTGVSQRGPSCQKVDEDDIRLMCKGKPLTTKSSRIHLGQTVEIALNRRVEDIFVEEEGWLLPLTETCAVCCDKKRVSEMPTGFITKACEHKPATCKECVGQWIRSSMDTRAWDRLKCPECPKLLGFDDVRALATREVFDRYDKLATNAALTGMRSFRWCLNPRCQSGQIDRTTCPKVKCHACRENSCSTHNVPWHRGETCDEYDKRTREQRKGEKASEKWVKGTTKNCPKCHLNVHKYSGCDHITCICGHEWCYVCLATYYLDQNALLQCKHKRECKYVDDPPNYEGGRAFLPFMNAHHRVPPGIFGLGPPPNANPNTPPQPPAPRFPGPLMPPNRPAPPAVFPRVLARPRQRAGPLDADAEAGEGEGEVEPLTPGPEPEPAPRPRPRPRTDPFWFMMQDMLGQAHMHRMNMNMNVNMHERGDDNEFLEAAAAMLTLEQWMQRVRS